MRLLIDACVLYPTVPRALILGLAQTGWAEVRWSARILEEWRRAVLRQHPEQAGQVTREIASLQALFPGAEVAPDAAVESGLSLPDDNDRHVLAAALAAQASDLVTFNLRDFPGRTLARHSLRPRHPDELLLEALDDRPKQVTQLAQQIVAPLCTGPVTPADLRRILKKARLPRLGKALAARGS
ncbi:RSP_2648 family PIN domain-containing protein [Meridianimarinicoccus sp. MJW13]|uniref:RSP_2648 family PIN domain-containing protein n=1 Tax=Meridianimarinicoccus sp. MJW13 TaxID=2720031 RepID=UPI0018689876|nr:PIN domain-containing protein [Fluviibacterium sp. MJW13]